MFVTALGCRAARKLNEPKCTKQGRESKPTLAVGGADGVKQIDSYRYYDTDAAANTEWYTFLMLISARQMSERAPAGKLENEQKASQPANAPLAVMRHKSHGWELSCCCHSFLLTQNVKQTRSNLTYICSINVVPRPLQFAEATYEINASCELSAGCIYFFDIASPPLSYFPPERARDRAGRVLR